MFGKVREVPQRETTPFYPRSPYGVSKVFAHYITVNYRESYGLFAVSGILFNHESPRRGLEFVTRKVTDGVARIKLGLAKRTAARQPRRAARLGLRRRLRARDVADAAAGRTPTTTSSRPARATRCSELVEVAFGRVGLDWQQIRRAGPGVPPSGRSRPLDRRRARRPRGALGWTPTVTFEELVGMMVDADIELTVLGAPDGTLSLDASERSTSGRLRRGARPRRTPATRLPGSATFLPAMSNAVP